MSFINDYNFGINSESEILQILRNTFNPNLEIVKYQFSLFDYEGENCLIELKSRKCTKNFYKTTMIGCNKILKASELYKKNNNINIYFVFRFIDCLTYWKFDEEKMKKLKIKEGGRSDRGKKENGLYFYIPIEDLINI